MEHSSCAPPGTFIKSPAADLRASPDTSSRIAMATEAPTLDTNALLEAISIRFATVERDGIDQAIEDTLSEMGAAMLADSAHLYRIYHDERLMEHTHGWNVDQAPREFTQVNDTEMLVYFPWIAQQLKRLSAVVVDSIDTLQHDAPNEYLMFQRVGVQSLLFVPMTALGEPTGFFCFMSHQREVAWGDGCVSFVRIVGTILTGVIERQRIEAEQRQLSGILEATSYFVGVIEKETRRFQYINRAGREMLGKIKEADLALLHLDDIIPKAAMQRLLEEALPLVEATGRWTGDSVLRTNTGKEIVVSQNITVLPRIAGEACYSTSMRDISEQKEMENALRRENEFTQAVLNGSGAIFMVLDRDGRIVRFNPAAESLTGYHSQEVLTMHAWDIFVPQEELKNVKGVFNRLASGDKPSQTESTLIAKDGSRRVISWSNTVLQGENGKVTYIIQSGVDITEAKRLEKEVLDIAEHEQARFGQDLHDGLGQHLAGIEFMSQALEQKLTESQPEAASAVRDIKDLIRSAITQTRDLARGLSPVVLQSKGLEAALRDLASSITKRTGLNCIFESDAKIIVTHEEASIHLYRIAQESVANAIKHGKATEITISIRNVARRLELKIEDNGSGFAEDFKDGKGMGLRGMNYRAGIIGGSLDIVMRPGATAIVCSVQLSPLDAAPSRAPLPPIVRH
ncbi:MAG: PAS domain S-box protein [Verrucomicrobiae bacterium]|nr:PAS domain S-box protein [Verrucomicrobiae bacterium]